MASESHQADQLRTTTVSSLGWAWAGVALQAGMQLAYTAAISRIVAPAEFGILAAGMLVLKVIAYLGRAGISAAVVQRPKLSADDLAAANSLALLAGVVGACAGVVAAPIFGFLIGVPGVVGVTRWIALGLVLGAPSIVPDAQLRREMKFRKITALQTIAYFGSNILLAIPLALMGFERAALLTAYLAGVLIYSGLARASVKPRPGFTRSLASMRQFIRFGGTVAATSLLDVASSSADTIYAGRLGSGALGQYNRASMLISLPLEQVSAAAAGPARAALARLQHDPQRFATGLLTSIGLQAGLVAVVVGYGAATATPLVGFALGAQWAEAATLLPLLAIAHGLALVTQQVVGAAESLGKVRARLQVQAACTGINLVVVSAFYFSTRSLGGVAMGWLLGESARLFGHLRMATRHLGVATSALVRRLSDALLLGAVAAAAPMLLAQVLRVRGAIYLLISGIGSLTLVACIASMGLTAAIRGDLRRLQMLERAKAVVRSRRRTT